MADTENPDRVLKQTRVTTVRRNFVKKEGRRRPLFFDLSSCYYNVLFNSRKDVPCVCRNRPTSPVDTDSYSPLSSWDSLFLGTRHHCSVDVFLGESSRDLTSKGSTNCPLTLKLFYGGSETSVKKVTNKKFSVDEVLDYN